MEASASCSIGTRRGEMTLLARLTLSSLGYRSILSHQALCVMESKLLLYAWEDVKGGEGLRR